MALKRLSPWNWIALLCLLGATLATGVTAQAQEIGVAVTILNDVNGVLTTRTIRINTGEYVFRNEIVTTGQESSAKLVFADNTNLAVGPRSTVTLDRFVYADAPDYKEATVQLVKGAFRFMTGNSDKRAYEIHTTVATIGVRGTIVDILSELTQTIVVLQEGGVLACTRSTPPRCTQLSKPGDTAIITATSVTNGHADGGGGWSFASFCAADLCKRTILASSRHPGGAVAPLNDHGLGRGDMFFFPGGGFFSGGERGHSPVSPH